MVEDDVVKLLFELEGYFKKRVFVIQYNPIIEKGIDLNDEVYIEYFIQEILKKENVRHCVIIFNGFGGDLRTAILCSSLLRKNLDYYSCFVPSVIGSSLCYFALQANQLIVGQKSILTQIDPLIEHRGELLRAIKNLTNMDGEIRKKAHNAISYNIEILKKILKKGKLLSRECFSGRNEINIHELERIINLFMGKELHESGLRIKELCNLKISLRIESPEIISLANKVLSLCREELFDMDNDNRLIIQTTKGGYFFQ